MVDAGHTSLRCIRSSRLARAVHAHKRAGAIGLGDRRGKLRFGVLVGRREGVAVEMVSSGLVDLGEVRALLALLTHHRDDLVGSVRVVGVREHVLRGVEADGVFMAAQDVDGVAGNAHARARNQAAVDGIAHGDVGAPGALGAHVALGGEAGHHIGLGGGCSQQGALRHGLFDRLQAFVAGVKEEMGVRVDEARHQRRIAEVDHDRASGPRDVRAGLANALAFDQDFARRKNLAGSDIEDASRVENGDVGLRLLRRRGDRAARESDGQN